LPERDVAKGWQGLVVLDQDGERLGDCTGIFADAASGATEASGKKLTLATDASGILDPRAQAIVDALSSSGPQPIETLTPELARKQPGPDDAVKKLLGTWASPPTRSRGLGRGPPGARYRHAGGTQTLRVYKPEGVINAAPIIMWIHGGGWGAVRHRHLRRVLPRTGQQDGLHHRQSRPLPSAPGFRHCGDEPAAGAASRCDRGAAAVTVAGMPPRSTPLRWPSRFLAGHEDAARRAGRATLRPLRHPAVLITGAVVLLAGCAGTDRGTACLRPQAAGSASARASAPPAR